MTEAIRFYCGIGEQQWNHHEVAPGSYACISPVYGRNVDTVPSRRVNRVQVPASTLVIQDSGAFSDGPTQRLSVEEALERQIAHAERYGYADQVTHRASYDLLIDEKWEGGIRYKARWTEEDAEMACKLTIKAADYLDKHRNGLAAILSAQGVSPQQYLRCAEKIVPSMQDGDMFGLGGWCILAPMPLTSEQETDLYAALQALDRVIATLEQDEVYQRETALGNDVVRLNECYAVTEGERVLEQYQADLKAKGE